MQINQVTIEWHFGLKVNIFPLWVVDNRSVSNRPRPLSGPGGSVQLLQTAIAVVVVVANIHLTDVYMDDVAALRHPKQGPHQHSLQRP